MTTLKINGEEKTIDARTVSDVVAHYGLEKNLVVVELDGQIIERNDWEATAIENGMTIELVHFVGGG
ncbi:MAG TPA: sulfur carrier protein ThiS [Bacilli bacterium]|nr:sulfur carrier protein ThiS [Bacilli bacterium]